MSKKAKGSSTATIALVLLALAGVGAVAFKVHTENARMKQLFAQNMARAQQVEQHAHEQRTQERNTLVARMQQALQGNGSERFFEGRMQSLDGTNELYRRRTTREQNCTRTGGGAPPGRPAQWQPPTTICAPIERVQPPAQNPFAIETTAGRFRVEGTWTLENPESIPITTVDATTTERVLQGEQTVTVLATVSPEGATLTGDIRVFVGSLAQWRTTVGL